MASLASFYYIHTNTHKPVQASTCIYKCVYFCVFIVLVRHLHLNIYVVFFTKSCLKGSALVTNTIFTKLKKSNIFDLSVSALQEDPQHGCNPVIDRSNKIKDKSDQVELWSCFGSTCIRFVLAPVQLRKNLINWSFWHDFTAKKSIYVMKYELLTQVNLSRFFSLYMQKM